MCCSVLQCVALCCSVLYEHACRSALVPRGCVWCSVMQRVAACCILRRHTREFSHVQEGFICCSFCSVLQCVAVCCSVLQCVAVCCSVLQCVANCCSVLQSVAVIMVSTGDASYETILNTLQVCVSVERVAVYCSVLQCVAACCSVLRCVPTTQKMCLYEML